ncbi:MAG: hypothetical protein R6V85_20855 [Polyangia bacterium]
MLSEETYRQLVEMKMYGLAASFGEYLEQYFTRYPTPYGLTSTGAGTTSSLRSMRSSASKSAITFRRDTHHSVKRFFFNLADFPLAIEELNEAEDEARQETFPDRRRRDSACLIL